MTLQNNRPFSRATGWDDVEIGDAVHLHRGGRLEHAGRVENRTVDGAVVWVVSTGGDRKLFHVADGFELSVADTEGADHADN